MFLPAGANVLVNAPDWHGALTKDARDAKALQSVAGIFNPPEEMLKIADGAGVVLT